ncbi:hypothetical protein N0V94_007908 [Neodidymelliopsis sp. IMI 364377]|nr:hypothetical protein N0V94_007908 [Neodidymelliopsis sp. IMI 364377]
MADMDLTAYRDAIDYLSYFMETIGSMVDKSGLSSGLSKRVMGERAGTVKGVRIDCTGDQAGDSSQEFVQVVVPKAHPLFMGEGDDPLDIPHAFGEDWVVYKYTARRDATSEDTCNPRAKLLLLGISEDYLEEDDWGKVPEWRTPHAAGIILVVNATRKDLDVCMVKAVCMAMEKEILPLLADDDYDDREAVLDALNEEFIEQYM